MTPHNYQSPAHADPIRPRYASDTGGPVQAPLSSATLQNSGNIGNITQLSDLVGQGNHVPIWTSRALANDLLTHYGADNSVVGHPGVAYGSSGSGGGGLPIGDVPTPTGGQPGIDYNPSSGGPTVEINPGGYPYAPPANPFGGAVGDGYTDQPHTFGGYGLAPVGGGDFHNVNHNDDDSGSGYNGPPDSNSAPNKHDPSAGLERADMGGRLDELMQATGATSLADLHAMVRAGTLGKGLISAAISVPPSGGGRMPVSSR